MDIESILGELLENRGYFPREAVMEAIRQREAITPHLLRSIQEATEAAPVTAPKDLPFLPLYALFLLAQFRERRAYPLVAALCRLPEDTVEGVLGDTITEGLSRIVASVFDGDTAPIKSVVENPSLGEFVRGSWLRSLSVLVHAGVLARGDVIAYHTELFRGKLEMRPSPVWNVLASEAADLHAVSLAADIQRAFEEGRVDSLFAGPDELARVLAMPEETVLAHSRERCRGLIDDVVAEMGWWHCFNLKKMPGKKPAGPLDAAARSHDAVEPAKPKISRNAPCPCGSGKKYKKCCGAG